VLSPKDRAYVNAYVAFYLSCGPCGRMRLRQGLASDARQLQAPLTPAVREIVAARYRAAKQELGWYDLCNGGNHETGPGTDRHPG
jgi:hypothetical protein